MVVQIEHDKVEISWTAPPNVPPRDGYRISTNISNDVEHVSAPPHIITVPTPGVYSVRVVSLSRHYPEEMVETEFIANGEHYWDFW